FEDTLELRELFEVNRQGLFDEHRLSELQRSGSAGRVGRVLSQNECEIDIRVGQEFRGALYLAKLEGTLRRNRADAGSGSHCVQTRVLDGAEVRKNDARREAACADAADSYFVGDARPRKRRWLEDVVKYFGGARVFENCGIVTVFQVGVGLRAMA